MNTPIIHQCWLGGPMPRRELALARSVQWMNNMAYHFWTEANLHELGLEPWQWQHDTHAGSTNLIRLVALHQMGGIWLDTDVECLRPLDKLLDYNAFFALDKHGVPCNAIMGARAGHPWIKWLLDNLGDIRLKDAAWPCHLIEQSPLDDVTVVPTGWLYPWSYDEPEDRSRITDQTLTAHYWNKSWVQANEEKT